jgi:hypothetical protein
VSGFPSPSTSTPGVFISALPRAEPTINPISWSGPFVNVVPDELISPFNWTLIAARYEYCEAVPPIPTTLLTPITFEYVWSGELMIPRASVPFASASPTITILLNPNCAIDAAGVPPSARP